MSHPETGNAGTLKPESSKLTVNSKPETLNPNSYRIPKADALTLAAVFLFRGLRFRARTFSI